MKNSYSFLVKPINFFWQLSYSDRKKRNNPADYNLCVYAVNIDLMAVHHCCCGHRRGTHLEIVKVNDFDFWLISFCVFEAKEKNKQTNN